MSINKINYIIISVIFAVLLLGMFSYITIAPLWYDENMYISASVLIQTNALYKDFAYLQMPYLPILYGLFYKLTGISYYLLSAELFNFFFMVLSALLIYFISYRISNNIIVSLSMLLLFVFNKVIIETMRYSANAIMPIPFALMGFYLFNISVSEKHINRLGVFLSGICVAVATGTKLYYAAMLPPFFFICLFYPFSLTYIKRIVKIFLPLMAGVIIGLVPALYYLLNDFDVFMFNNFGYHRVNTTWREVTGYTRGMSTVSKMVYGWKTLAFPSNVALFIGGSFLFFTLVSEKQYYLRDHLSRFFQMENLLVILLVLFTTAAAFTPTPLWIHYFAMPIPFVIILLSCWYSTISKPNRHLAQILFVCLILVSLVWEGEQLFRYINQLPNTGNWKGISVHNTAKQIRYHIGVIENSQKIATLSPLYAIEAGLPIYKELSTGSFLYRVGDLIPDTKKNSYVGTSPKNLHTLFEKDPPKAILVGFQDIYNLGEPFIKYAVENNYVKIQKDFDGMTLYVRKDR